MFILVKASRRLEERGEKSVSGMVLCVEGEISMVLVELQRRRW